MSTDDRLTMALHQQEQFDRAQAVEDAVGGQPLDEPQLSMSMFASKADYLEAMDMYRKISDPKNAHVVSVDAARKAFAHVEIDTCPYNNWKAARDIA